MRVAVFVATGMIVLAASSMGCESDEARPVDENSPVAAASRPIDDLPAGIEERGPVSRPAASDAHGKWQELEIAGVSVEIPFSDQWRVQIILDPCFGDERYYLLLENRDTFDRIRVDMVNPEVATESKDPTKLDAISERILRSVKGSHVPPRAIQTAGPLPTMTTCPKEDDGAVPTLIPDDFTPPATDSRVPGRGVSNRSTG